VKYDNAQLEELAQIKKPLLILAGPGTGKTHALAYKTKHLIKKEGVPKDEIAIITFTNEAAISMRKKISSEGDEDIYIEPELQPSAIWTMHKFCNKIIGDYYSELGLEKETEVIPLQKLKDILIKDSAQLVGAKRSEGKDTILCRQKGECRKSISLKCKICFQYEQLLRESKLIDHDDQIFLVCKLLKERDQILKRIQRSAKYLLVDEYQDINYAQWELIKLLTKGNTNNLFVVGDDYQSIYSFRGGDPKFIRNFKNDYAPDAVIRHLLTSWRCPRNILKGAFYMVNKYCGGDVKILNNIEFKNKSNAKIKMKIFDYQTPEAAYLAATIKRIGPSHDVLILIPWLSYAEPIKLALRRKFINFSCEYDLEDTDIYLINVLLSWLNDTSNDFCLRLLIEEIINRGASDIPAEQAERRGLGESLRKREEAIKQISNYWIERGERRTLYKKIKALNKYKEFEKLVEIITEIRKAYKLGDDSVNFISEIMRKLKLWRNIPAFKEEMNSVYGEIKGLAIPPGENSVRIMTMMKAKGLQADYVFLVGLENNVLPRENASNIEKAEGSRLLYVSMTRAKKGLYLLHSKARERKITMFQIEGRSEFIEAIPKEYIEEMDSPA
jgi:DNA helicase-2/ATP-dependent DNA helicase PcrA